MRCNFKLAKYTTKSFINKNQGYKMKSVYLIFFTISIFMANMAFSADTDYTTVASCMLERQILLDKIKADPDCVWKEEVLFPENSRD
jgi:hypothetical protein